jgi:hypothetical protein
MVLIACHRWCRCLEVGLHILDVEHPRNQKLCFG